MKLTWYGHACFMAEENGYAVVLDPYAPGKVPGLALPELEADRVLASHEHADHNYLEGVRLRDRGTVSPFRITTMDTWHDDRNGTLRGSNRITVLETDSARVAHLGDLGCGLTPEQKQMLKNLDAVMVPVGGHYTIDAEQADALVREIRPAVVIPMHFRLGNVGYDVLQELSQFLSFRQDTVFYDSNVIEITGGMDSRTAVLQLP